MFSDLLNEAKGFKYQITLCYVKKIQVKWRNSIFSSFILIRQPKQ